MHGASSTQAHRAATILPHLIDAATRLWPAAGRVGRTALWWAPYYLAKFVIIKTVKRYGTFRLYRRAAEASRKIAPGQQGEAFLVALKSAVRAPAAGYAKLMKFDKLLWQWICRMENAQDDAADGARSHEMKLVAASTKLLLLARGSTPPAAISAGDTTAAGKR